MRASRGKMELTLPSRPIGRSSRAALGRLAPVPLEAVTTVCTSRMNHFQ